MLKSTLVKVSKNVKLKELLTLKVTVLSDPSDPIFNIFLIFLFFFVFFASDFLQE